jgi:hypothetical protein
LLEPLADKDVRLGQATSLVRDWLDCIRTRRRPLADVEAGARSATVAHLGNVAYWNRRKLRWDPATSKLVGDEEAMAWLDRDRREPYRLPKV